MHIAQRLTEIRRERNMSLKALAQATHLSVLTLSGLERGRASPTDAALDAISAAYAMSRTALLTDTQSGLPVSLGPLPPGLRALAAETGAGDIQPAHIQTLRQLELRGRRLMSKAEWRELLFNLPGALTAAPTNGQHDSHE